MGNNQIGVDSCMDQWYCLGCGWNAKIEHWTSSSGLKYYLCQCCGMKGLTLDGDAPKFLNYQRDWKLNETTFDFEKRLWPYNLD